MQRRSFLGLKTAAAVFVLAAVFSVFRLFVPAEAVSEKPVVSVKCAVYGAEVEWTAVSGADKYCVYRRAAGGEWHEIGLTARTVFADRSAENGTVYYYSVRACFGASEGRMSSAAKLFCLEAPKTTVRNTAEGILVKWERNEFASGYIVYRNGEDGKTETLGSTELVRWVDAAAEPGAEYSYSVRAVSEKSESAVRRSKNITRLTPAEVFAENTGDGIGLSWSAVPGAERYFVYRFAEGEGMLPAGETEKLSFTDAEALPGAEYSYYVRACCGESEGTVSEPAGIVRLVSPVISVNSVSGMAVCWDEVPGAEKYTVFRALNGEWEIIAETETAGYMDRTVYSGREYSYCVQADSGQYSSVLSNEAGARYLSAIKVSAKNSPAGVSLSWNCCDGAEGYKIWRSDNGGKWLLAGTTGNTVFFDRKAESGDLCRYKVTAFTGDSEGNGIETEIVRLSAPETEAEEVMAGVGVSWEEVPGAEYYRVLRTTQETGWSYIASVKTPGYTDTSAILNRDYIYAVQAVSGGYSSGTVAKTVSEKPGIPENPGYAPECYEKIVYGTSGMGRELCAYRYGSGENTLILTFCVHGYEDGFYADGRALVYTAFRLMEEIPFWDTEEWSIYVLPCCNPDGLIDGYSENGAGRCTTTMLDWSGNLVVGLGVDINRSFPAYWTGFYSSRYYNGPRPLSCFEAAALAEFMEDKTGSGENIFIDVHGWTTQIITSNGMNSKLFRAFSKYFPRNTWANVYGSEGYITAYAAMLGYDSCLFEFPDRIRSLRGYVESVHCGDFVEAVKEIVEN
ncbi:MAG: M14 family zinc carboxypeptidase [Eubacteriales bacterium]